MSVKSEYAKKKAYHKCTSCGNKDENTIAGKTRCRKCDEKQRNYNTTHRQKCKEKHICPDCNNKTELKPNGGYYIYCKKCRIKRSQKLYERRHKDEQ